MEERIAVPGGSSSMDGDSCCGTHLEWREIMICGFDDREHCVGHGEGVLPVVVGYVPVVLAYGKRESIETHHVEPVPRKSVQ